MTNQSSRRFDLRDSPRPITRRIGKGWRRGKIVERDPHAIDSICVHQTACEFGAGRWRLRKAGGDRQKAIAHRALDQPYHAMSFDGFYSLACPVGWYTYHANALNRRSVGIGIDGLYPAFERGRRRKHTQLTEARLWSAKQMLVDVVCECEREGIDLKYVFGHMQSNRRKPDDPGEMIWRQVVEGFLVKHVGLKPIYNLNEGGRAIPLAWR